MESSDFRRLLLTSYNITPQGGGEDVVEDHSHVHTQIKAPFAPSKQTSHTLSTISLDCNDPNVSHDRHMPESPYIIHAITFTISYPRGLQDQTTSDVHIFYSGQKRSVASSTGAGTRLHPSLRVSAGVSTASFTIERHFHLLPKNRRSLVCLIF